MLRAILVFCFVAWFGVQAIPSEVHLLGAKQCTWGPSYWCSNLTAAAGCHATKHCLQTVWPHKIYPEDTDSICQTCLDMVKQARDQLESNETQEEIKEVFEGSCKLIPIKIVSKECCKLADDFIPDLIDTLASQMNPQTVCSVAGLCNSAKIDQLLLEAENADPKTENDEADRCQGCHHVMSIMENKFTSMSKDEFLQRLLQMCGQLGSFSDGCSNIVITYFSEIYNRMKNDFTSEKICLLSGECSVNFHVHPEIEVTPLSKVGFVSVKSGDDPACKLCKQLVGHLRDLLIADTTEAEFQKVLQGLCKQTGNFADECLGIVNQYYPVIYKYLMEELNSTIVCDFAGICPGPGFDKLNLAPIAPLLPAASAPKAKELMKQVQGGQQLQFEDQTPELMQLPIERIGSPFVNNVYNKELCTFCQYFLHYVQEEITNPKTESQLKDIVDKACERLPNSVTETCVEFVNSYGEALVALLAEEIDPATICPLIRVCPSETEAHDIEVFMQANPRDKPNCPLCLFAVTKVQEMIKDDKTRTSIKTALKNLCGHLNDNLRTECQDFVDGYTDELVEMLIDDFKPQEICVYLKICKDNRPSPKTTDIYSKGSVFTNEIPDYTANGRYIAPQMKSVQQKPSCPLCEFIMTQLQTALEDKKTEEEIKQAIHNVCHAIPKTLQSDCDKFVDKYADMIFELLASSVEPKEICVMLNLCDNSSIKLLQQPKPLTVSNIQNKKVKGGPQCFICKRAINALEDLIGKVSEDQLKNAVKTVCSILPNAQEDGCDDLIEKYGDTIYEFLREGTQPGEICSLMLLCADKLVESITENVYTCAICQTTVSLVDEILANPKLDHKVEHVFEKACAALPAKHQKKCASLIESYGDKIFNYLAHVETERVCKEIGVCHRTALAIQKRDRLVGSDRCTWGPGYWCQSEETAKECGDGSLGHCRSKVWKADKPADAAH